MVEPLVRFCQWHLMTSNASEDGRIRTPETLRVWELPRQTPIEQIQYPRFFYVKFFLFLQNSPALNSASEGRV